MNNTEKKLLELLKESQFGNGNISIDDVELVSLLKEAKYQSVLGLVLQFFPNKDLPEEYEYRNEIQIANYVRYLHEEDILKKTLDAAGIPFVILKGNAAAIYYKNPERRSMGDIDFLVSEAYYVKAKEILLASGYKIQQDECANDRHIILSMNKQLFELHRRFSYIDSDIEDVVSQGMKAIEIHNIDGYEFPMLPKLANGLVLLEHMREHLKSGLGLRQVIDWMMYVYRELDDDFWNNEFGRVAQEKELDKLAIISTRMCQIYLGLPGSITWCKNADEKLCEQLLENLLETGNFGRKLGKGLSVETVGTSIKRKGLFRWLQYAGEYNWKVYRKHHWLKPFCWLYQIFRYAKQGLKSGRNKKQLSEDLDRSEKRFELLKKLGIE